MAIHAQLPAKFLSSDFHRPPSSHRQENCVDNDGPFRHPFLQLYNSDLSNVAVQSANNNDVDGLDERCVMPPRKKLRQDETLLSYGGIHQHTHIDASKVSFRGMISQPYPTITVHQLPSSTNSQSSPNGPFQLSPSVGFSEPRFPLYNSPFTGNYGPSPRSEAKKDLCLSPILDKTGSGFASQFIQQKEDLNQIIQLHEEQMKQTLEDARRRHTSSLLALIDNHLMQFVQEKETEVQKVKWRNMELENFVKHLAVESQFWQNVAHNNEVMVANLRSNFQNVVAETQNQMKEGSGESNNEDMESCVNRMPDDDETKDACQGVDESPSGKNAQHCRICGVNNLCVLVLPCRHLCLCTDCDPHTPKCPVCGALKNATVQVYMD